jgi:hypothetical protein
MRACVVEVHAEVTGTADHGTVELELFADVGGLLLGPYYTYHPRAGHPDELTCRRTDTSGRSKDDHRVAERWAQSPRDRCEGREPGHTEDAQIGRERHTIRQRCELVCRRREHACDTWRRRRARGDAVGAPAASRQHEVALDELRMSRCFHDTDDLGWHDITGLYGP